MDVHDSPIVRNELEPAAHMNGSEPMGLMFDPITKQELVSSHEVPNFETGEKHKVGVNDIIEDLGSNFLENGSSRKLINWVGGASRGMEVDQELVKPCSQTAVVEFAESVRSSHSGSQNLNYEGNVCAVDADSLLESGCLNVSGAEYYCRTACQKN